jgi:hypothetical protein
MKSKLTFWTCQRCKHVWQQRMKKLPKICPKCKRKDWANGKGPMIIHSAAFAQFKDDEPGLFA